MHLDMIVDDLDAAEAAVLDLSATRHPAQPGTSCRIFLDPAGPPSAFARTDPDWSPQHSVRARRQKSAFSKRDCQQEDVVLLIGAVWPMLVFWPSSPRVGIDWWVGAALLSRT
jgi:hypothetical protein